MQSCALHTEDAVRGGGDQPRPVPHPGTSARTLGLQFSLSQVGAPSGAVDFAAFDFIATLVKQALLLSSAILV